MRTEDAEPEEELEVPPPRAMPQKRASARLPALTSSDWGFEEVPLPPGPGRR
jgi:hypothetical protein